jgi:hypothetical protein
MSGFNRLRRHREWPGFSKEQVANQKIEQFGLILSPSARDYVSDAESLRGDCAVRVSGQFHSIDRLPGPTAMKEKVGLIEIDEPLVLHSLWDQSLLQAGVLFMRIPGDKGHAESRRERLQLPHIGASFHCGSLSFAPR